MRVLQEMIAAGWSDREIADHVRQPHSGWFEVLDRGRHRGRETVRDLGPFTAEEVASLIATAFLGAEGMLLLGFERSDVPIRVRVAAHRHRHPSGRGRHGMSAAEPVATEAPSAGRASRSPTRVYGSGPTTVLLLPTWSIVPSRFWKLQVPFLSRHFPRDHVRRSRNRPFGRADRS